MSEPLLLRDAEHRSVWHVRCGGGFLGCIIRHRNGKLTAYVYRSICHNGYPVGNVAAGVRWIAARAPKRG